MPGAFTPLAGKRPRLRWVRVLMARGISEVTVVSRRGLFRWAGVMPVLAASACAPPTSPTTSPPATGPAIQTPGSTAPRSSKEPPDSSKQLGPNGRHWPARTLRPGAAAHTVQVACTWEAIAKALQDVTPRQAAAGFEIQVAAGTLPQSDQRDTLSELGHLDWKRNVLVVPRDGWGSVTMSGEARLRRLHRVTFARFNGDFVALTDCSGSNWAQSKLAHGLRIYAQELDVRDCNVYEAVVERADIGDQDPFVYAANGSGSLGECLWEGCYSAPVYRRLGSRAHLDTFQMFGRAPYRGLTLRDTVLFGSHNAALQLGGTVPGDPGLGTPFLTLENTLLTSQRVAAATRYPMPAGAEAPTLDQAINGAGEPHQLHASDSLVAGTMYTTKWGEVENSYVSSERSTQTNTAQSGSWTFRADLADMTADDLDQLAPRPSDSYLAQVWR